MEATLKALICGCLILGVLSQNEGPKVTDFGYGNYSCEHARLAWNSHIYFIEQQKNTPIDYPIAMNGMFLTKTSSFNTLIMKIQYIRNFPQTPACKYLQWDSQNITLEKSTPPNFQPIEKVPTISPHFRSASSKDKLEFICTPNMGESRIQWVVYDDSELKKVMDTSKFTITDIVVGQGKHASRLEILKTSGDAMFVFCYSINTRGIGIENLYSDMAVLYVSDSNPFKKYWWLILLGVILVIGIIAGITFCVYKCRAGNRRQYGQYM